MSNETPTQRRRYEKRARAAKEQETGSASSTPRSRCTARSGRRARRSRRSPTGRGPPGDGLPALPGLSGRCSSAARARSRAQPAAGPGAVGVGRRPGGAPRTRRWAGPRLVRAVEPMFSAVLRDLDTMPIVAELQAATFAYLAAVEDGLVPAGVSRGRRPTAARDDRPGARLRQRGGRCYQRDLGRVDTVAVMASAVVAAGRSS